MRGRPWPKSWPGSPAPPSASATGSVGVDPQPLQPGRHRRPRHHEVDEALLAAAERCGLLTEEPRQTRRTLASGRQVGLAHPGRPRHPPTPERAQASPALRAVHEAKERG